MAKVSMLIKKVYLLAGVVMAANMFVVNEVKAMEPEKIIENNDNKKEKIGTETQKKNDVPGTNIFEKVLSHENIINLFGGLAFSCVNNYFKWWDYNPCWYGQFGCFGWKSKRFLYDVVQFEFNFNLGRGALWSFIHIMNRIKTSGKVKINNNFSLTSFFLKDILRGFTSMPLTFHISNFSISFSLDSLLWAGVDIVFLKLKGKKKVKEEEEGPKKKGNGPTNTEINKLDDNTNNNSNPNKSESGESGQI